MMAAMPGEAHCSAFSKAGRSIQEKRAAEKPPALISPARTGRARASS
jgi:hypothetical protein